MPIQENIEVLNPANIQSEVPKEQPLRQPLQHDSELKMADDIKMADGAKNEDSYVEVFTTKREEAVLTKGDLKLQKMEELYNPLYSEIHSEVIEGPHPLREFKEDLSNGDNQGKDKKGKSKLDEDAGTTNTDNKPKSRIPTMRLRQVADRIRREIRESTSEEKKNAELKSDVPTPQPRRSSIPRRRRRSYKSPPPPKQESEIKIIEDTEKTQFGTIPEKKQEKKSDIETKTYEKNNSPEEFDRLYDEIIHTDESLPFIDTNVQLLPIVDNLEDPVSLENTFEEMMHDYEKHNVEPINVKEIKSKIPLRKQQSLPEGEFIKRFDRRQSLKDTSPDGAKSKDVRAWRKSKLNEIRNRHDKNTKEDLKDHRRLSKEILKSKPINQNYKKQAQIVKVVKIPNKTSGTNSKPQSYEYSNESGPVLEKKPESDNDINKNTYEISDNVNQISLTERTAKESDEMPESTKIVQNITRQKNNKIKSYHSRPPLIEETLPSATRQCPENVGIIEYTPENSTEFNAQDENNNKKEEESSKYSISTLKGKVSKIASKFSLNEPQSVKPKPEPKTRYIFSDCQEKKCDDQDNNFTKSIDDKGTTIDKTGIIYDNDQINEKHSEIDVSYKAHPTRDITKTKNSVISEGHLYNEPAKPHFTKTESQPLEIPKKPRILPGLKTPPNTPQVNTDVEILVNTNMENLKRFEHACDKLGIIKDENETRQTITKETTFETDNRQLFYDNSQNIDCESQGLVDSYNKYIDNNAVSVNKDNLLNEGIELDDNYEVDVNKIKTQNTSFDTALEENDFNLRGKVSRIVKRIDSVEEKIKDASKKDISIPVQKSVSSRIAMFEQQASANPRKSKLVDNYNTTKVCTKPRIIEQVLKSQHPRSNHESILTQEDSKAIAKICEDKNNNQEDEKHIATGNHIVQETIQYEVNPLDVLSCDTCGINEIDKNSNIFENLNNEISQGNYDKDKIDDTKTQPEEIVAEETNCNILIKGISKDKRDIPMTKGDIDKTACNIEVKKGRGQNVDEPLNNAKSVAELDLGNEVIGKVHQLIVQMKSMEVSDVKKENRQDMEKIIKAKERPRKKSVTDKIALFERKMNVIGTAPAITTEFPVTTIAATTRQPIKTLKRETISPVKPIDTSTPISIDTDTVEPSLDPAQTNYEQSTKDHTDDKDDIDNTYVTNLENPTKSTNATALDPTENATYQEHTEDLKNDTVNIDTHGNDSSNTKSPILDPTEHPTYQKRIEELKAAKDVYGSVPMEYFELNNGIKMPVLALGTALLDPTLLPYIVGAAIDLGYRAIDTAYIYGNEQEVGDAIRAKVEDGTVLREELFIIGKLWSTFHRRDLVEEACRASLEALGLEYFDLYLVHNPMSFKEGKDPFPRIAKVLQYSTDADYLDAWYGMEGLVAKGLTRSIGVSNFNSQQIARVVEKGKIRPAVNQVECHPYLTQQRLGQFCGDRHIPLMCYGTLGSTGTPKEYRAHLTPVIQDPRVTKMAAELRVSVSQLLLSYQIRSGHLVVVKASSAAHLWNNLQSLSLRLNDEELDSLNNMNRNKRTYDMKGMGDTHRHYPFKIPF